jgi:hypothetical protein
MGYCCNRRGASAFLKEPDRQLIAAPIAQAFAQFKAPGKFELHLYGTAIYFPSACQSTATLAASATRGLVTSLKRLTQMYWY